MTLIRVCRELILPHPRSELPPQTIYREKTKRSILCHGDPDRVNNLPTTCKPAPKTLLLYHLHQDEDGGQDAVIPEGVLVDVLLLVVEVLVHVAGVLLPLPPHHLLAPPRRLVAAQNLPYPGNNIIINI